MRGAPAARAVRETRSFPAPIQHFPRVSPDEAKMKLNIPSLSLPSSTFAPYAGDSSIHAMPEIRASNKRRSGGRGGCLPVMAAQMRQVTTFCRASEQRRRSGSWVARSFAGAEWGVIERSPGSLETHFPFPQNERSGRPTATGQVQGERGKQGEGRTARTATTVLSVEGPPQCKPEASQGKTRRRKGCAITIKASGGRSKTLPCL